MSLPSIQLLYSGNVFERREKEVREPLPPCGICRRDDMVIGWGRRHNLAGAKQVYFCKRDGHKFTHDDFKGVRFSPKIIAMAIDLSRRGLSYQEVLDHIYRHRATKVAPTTILYWVRRYGKG